MSITSETLRPDLQLFPAATSVGAYLPSAWSSPTIAGAPAGSAVSTASVQTDGTLTFTALVENTHYIAYASVGGVDRIFRFDTRNSGGPAHVGGEIVVPDTFEVPFSTTTAQAVASTDAANYSNVAVHIVTQGGSSTVTFQGSNDNTNWVSVALLTVTSTSGSLPVSATTGAGSIFTGALPFRYFRLNVTGIASGTTAGVVEFKSAAGAAVVTATQATPATPTASIINSAATTNATAVKTSGASVYALDIFNNGAGAAYVKLYNKASAPTVGTDVPALVIPVAAGAYVGCEFGALGIRLGTGFGLAITGAAADSDTTAVAASQVKVVSSYV